MNVVDFGAVRNVLQDWDSVRQKLVKQRARGAAVCIKWEDGSETVFLCGGYKTDPQGALKAAMRMSVELTRANDDPLDFAASEFGT